MIDAEYIEEIAVEVGALMNERDAIYQRISGWFEEAAKNGVGINEILTAVYRQKAAVREAAPTQGQTALAL